MSNAQNDVRFRPRPWEGFGHEPRARVALIDVCSPVQSVKTRHEGVLLDQRPLLLHYAALGHKQTLDDRVGMPALGQSRA
jgi:hypothetical protein